MGERWSARKGRATIISQWTKQRWARLDIARVSKVAGNADVQVMAVRDNIVDIAIASGCDNSISNSQASGSCIENIPSRLGASIFAAEEGDM